MKKYKILFIGLFLLVNNLYASPKNFDIYGVDEKTQDKIYSSCSKLMEKYLITLKSINSPDTLTREKAAERWKQIEDDILSKVKTIDDFQIAEISPIFYPSDGLNYATLDLVKSQDKKRLPKKSKQFVKKTIKKDPGLSELFNVWVQYENRNLELIQKNQMGLSKKTCPIDHCTWGFDAKELKNTLPKLQSGAAKYKKSLIEIIKYSDNEKDRSNAIFILANNNHYQDLVKLLTAFINDPSSYVRNNTMRVLGAIASKHKVKDIDISSIIDALNYPYVTDRNKAGYILLGLVKKSPDFHQIVINKSGDTLIHLLKLKQPNNHDFAYLILKEISHKNFGERDYVKWENWLNSQRKT